MAYESSNSQGLVGPKTGEDMGREIIRLREQVKAGCFFDSLEAFRAKVIKTHEEESKHGKLYLGVANLIDYKFEGE